MHIPSSLHPLVVAALFAVTVACSTPNGASGTMSGVPTDWQPAFRDRSLAAARDAHAAGDQVAAERRCATAIRYVDRQTVVALGEYADALDLREPASGAAVHEKVRRLERMQAEQANAREAGSSYLGFAPWMELDHYARLLAGQRRDERSAAIARLAVAYRQGQEAQIRRTLLMQSGKDPRGIC